LPGFFRAQKIKIATPCAEQARQKSAALALRVASQFFAKFLTFHADTIALWPVGGQKTGLHCDGTRARNPAALSGQRRDASSI